MVLSFIPRKPKKTIALGLIILGLLYLTPPVIPFLIWTEALLNLPTAKFILENTPIGNQLIAIFLTFTLVPGLLIYGGAFIYPHGTNSILHGILSRIKNGTKKYINLVKRKPINILWLFSSLALVYIIFVNYYLVL